MELRKDNTYLFKFYCGDSITAGTILLITNSSYFIRWNFGNGSDVWEEHNNFHRKYTAIENISDYVPTIEPLIRKEQINPYNLLTFYHDNSTNCPDCGGEGYKPDSSSTAGKVFCSRCSGSGKIYSINITANS